MQISMVEIIKRLAFSLLLLSILSANPSMGQEEIDLSTIENGTVNLPWNEFKRLIPFLTGKEVDLPPVDHIVSKADYRCDIVGKACKVNAIYDIRVLKTGWMKIPLLGTDVVIEEGIVNGKEIYLLAEKDKLYLIHKHAEDDKDIRLTVSFYVALQTVKGTTRFQLSVPSASANQLTFNLPSGEILTTVKPSIKTTLIQAGNNTMLNAMVPPTNDITVEWRERIVLGIDLTKETKIYAQIANLASVGSGLIRCSADIDYSIPRGKVSGFKLLAPRDVSVLRAEGASVSRWETKESDEGQIITVLLRGESQTSQKISVEYERELEDTTAVAKVPQIHALNADRETGYLGVEAITSVEIHPTEFKNLTRIDARELPRSLWEKAGKPIILGFRYIEPENIELTLDIQRHEDVEVFIATISNAWFTTVITEEGNMLTRALYDMRNNLKQFLKVTLPENASLWSVFVAQQPVKPASDKDGTILIPLIKSGAQGNETSFPVEIVFLTEAKKFEKKGEERCSMPGLDMPVNQISWEIYLPEEYKYSKFGGNVKELTELPPPKPAGWAAMSRDHRDMSKQLLFKSQAAKAGRRVKGEEKYGGYTQTPDTAIQAERVEEETAKGVLPVQIDIPEKGKKYKFTKLLVTDESPYLTFKYAKGFWLWRIF